IHDHRQVPFIWELEVHGYDYSSLDRRRLQNPGYYQLTSCDQNLVEHFLSEPAPVFTFDLHTIEEAGLPETLTFIRKIERTSRIDGFAVYFRARVDDDLILSTSPMDANRAPHWGFRILRTE